LGEEGQLGSFFVLIWGIFWGEAWGVFWAWGFFGGKGVSFWRFWFFGRGKTSFIFLILYIHIFKVIFLCLLFDSHLLV
jgi:hypothetical protein